MGAHSVKKDNGKKKKPENKILTAVIGGENSFSLHNVLVLAACVILLIVFSALKMGKYLAAGVFGILLIISSLTMLSDLAEDIRERKIFTAAFVTTIAAVLSFIVGAYAEAVCAALIYRAVSIFYGFLNSKYEDALGAFSDSIPGKVRLELDGELREVSHRAVEIDDIIVIKTGETIPLDGVVISGVTSVSMAKLGGNSTEIVVPKNGFVCAGCINLGKTIRVQVKCTTNETFAAKLTDIISHANLSPSVTERIALKTAKYFTPAVLLIAVICALAKGVIGGDWVSAIRTAAAVAALSACGCVSISIPFAFSSCVANLSRRGVIIKKNCFVQDLAETGTAVFCKNGVLTTGKYTVHDVVPMPGVNATKLMKAAVAAYSQSNSPVAAALRAEAENIVVDSSYISIIEEVPQKGVHAVIGNLDVFAGSAGYLKENGINFNIYDKPGMLIICVSIDGKYCGQITLSDKVRSGAFEMVDMLHLQGVNDVVMLTHDEARISKQMAASLNFDMVKYELDADGKLDALDYLMENKRNNTALAFVGNYRTDAELMELSDIGISIKTFGSDVALQVSDVCILGDEISRVGSLISAAKNCRIISYINLGVSAGAKLLMLILAIIGSMSLASVAFFDGILFCLAMLNSARELSEQERK